MSRRKACKPIAPRPSTALIIYSTEGPDFVADVYERSTRRLLLRFGGTSWPEHDTQSNVMYCAAQLARAMDKDCASQAATQRDGAP